MSRFFARRSASVAAAVALSASFLTVVPAAAETAQPAAAVAESKAPECSHVIVPSEKGALTLSYLPRLTTLAGTGGDENVLREAASGESIKDLIDSDTGKDGDKPRFVLEQRVTQKDVSVNGDTTTITYDGVLTFGRAKVNRYEYVTVTNLRSEVTGTTVNVYGDYTVIESDDGVPGPDGDVLADGGRTSMKHVSDSGKDVLLFTANLAEPIGNDVTVPGTSEFKVSAKISSFGSVPAVMWEHVRGDGGQYPARIEVMGETKTQCDADSEDPKDDPKEDPKGNNGSLDSLMKGTGPSIFGIGSLSALFALMGSLSFLIPMIKQALFR